jgi:hypothetical protein
MVDEYCNNPRDDSKKTFSKLKAHVIDISRNMKILMETLERNFGPFKEFGSSNSKHGSDEKYGDNKDPKKESKKESKKERPSSNSITSSPSLFKVKAKVDIKSYQGEIDVVELNQWLQQLEFYFSVHTIREEKKTSFAKLELEGHAQTLWESHTKTLTLEGDPLITK